MYNHQLTIINPGRFGDWVCVLKIEDRFIVKENGVMIYFSASAIFKYYKGHKSYIFYKINLKDVQTSFKAHALCPVECFSEDVS